MRLGHGVAAATIVTLVMSITGASVVARHASALTPTPRATSSPTEPVSTSAVTETPSPSVSPTRTPTRTIATATAVRTPTATVQPHGTPVSTPGGFFGYVGGVNLWIAVAGMPACSTEHGDATCAIVPGSTFVIDVYVDNMGLPYDGFDIALQHVGVVPNHDADTSAWPDCAFPAAAYDEIPNPQVIAFGCAIGVPPAGPSNYRGLIGAVSFVCAESGHITMLHLPNPQSPSTDLVDDYLQEHVEALDFGETLTVNCAQPAALPSAGTGAGHYKDVSFVTEIAVIAGAAFVALRAWGARRRRAGA